MKRVKKMRHATKEKNKEKTSKERYDDKALLKQIIDFSVFYITLYTAPLPPTPRNKERLPLPLCKHIYIT